MQWPSFLNLGTDVFERTTLNSSLDNPPNNPLFSNYGTKAPKRNHSLILSLVLLGLIKGDASTGGAMSPGKRTRVSGQYLQQLERFKTLQSSGVNQ